MDDKTDSGKPWLRPTYLPRLMLLGMIIIMLGILIPVLRERRQSTPTRPRIETPLAQVEAPLVMKYYSTGYASTDSLINHALRSFSHKDYDEAARVLNRVYFFWSLQVHDGRMKHYPEDLRYYLGLSEFYRGQPEKAAPFLEAEELASRFEEKYPWYLAHAYIAMGDYGRARNELERVVKLRGAFAAEAEKKIGQLPPGPGPPPPK